LGPARKLHSVHGTLHGYIRLRQISARRAGCSRRQYVSDPAEVARFVEQVGVAFGHIDVLANNAGIATVGFFAETSVEDLAAVIDVNLKGLMCMTHAVLPAMLARRQGVIVNVASGAGLARIPETRRLLRLQVRRGGLH
jgi:NADP-dependent 3-hydroxy acid dehydrogenase YdfG